MKSKEIVIKPVSKWGLVDLEEIWNHRDLFYIFAWRDIKVRYKQTLMGASWAVFQPLTQSFIFTIFFGRLAKIPSGDLPYPLFILTGIVFWNFFSGSLSLASNSLIENSNLVKKVYFPRVILPLSKVGVSLVDLLISSALLLLVVIYYAAVPHPLIFVIVPLGLMIATLAAGGLGMLLSAINIKYRDVRYVLPFFIQTLIFLTPVIYPSNILRPAFRPLMALNPMTGVVESIRVVMAGKAGVEWGILGISTLSAVILFFVGLYYFRSTERFFADVA